MVSTGAVCGVLFSACLAGFAADDGNYAGVQFERETALAEGVERFNDRVKVLGIGQDEPPLTSDEVVAAVRGWIPERPAVAPEVLKQYRKIAGSGKLPPGSSISFTRGWIYGGYRFEVWWIDLNIMTGEKTGYTFRIRDRTIRSEPHRGIVR